ncbi:hypothetical protein [Amycolatopsis iheyensis]|nr:hypothetical protein [Amycolatopsis iheyensis]
MKVGVAVGTGVVTAVGSSSTLTPQPASPNKAVAAAAQNSGFM